MLKCNEVTAMASDWLDSELTFTERMRIQVHLLMCRHCRNFVEGIAATRNAVRIGIPEEAPYTADLETRIQNRVAQRLTGDAIKAESSPADASACNDRVFRPVDESDDARVQAVFADIREHEGYVPNLFRSYAHNPEQLEQVWARVRSLMFGGRLSATLKNAIATLVSQDNGCDYCVFHHRRMLRQLGVNTNTLKRFLATAQADFLDECEQALLRLVREANRNPHQVPPDLLEEARSAGADNDNIIEAMSVMELYAGFNRLLDAFQIPIESAFADEHRPSV